MKMYSINSRTRKRRSPRTRINPSLQSPIALRVRRYLQRAYESKFNTGNYPIRATIIAEDLGLPTQEVVTAANLLVSQDKVEIIDKGFGPAPSYRIAAHK
ncbi:MAG TPA: hypothetical protein VJ183_05745 [Chloroflexia bacterium]|nr:hypothetical protein [Chloroflexia bacterium]